MPRQLPGYETTLHEPLDSSVSLCQVVYVVAGQPQVEGVQEVGGFACWLCGGRALPDGARVEEWIRRGFTTANEALCKSSPWICAACVYTTARLSPVPGRPPKEGKAHGGNFRNYAHMVEMTDGAVRYENASKGETERIVAFLQREKRGRWWCCVSESGQKHTLQYAPPNGPGVHGLVRMDEGTVRTFADAWRAYERVCELLDLGARKVWVRSGDWPHPFVRKHRDTVEAFERDFAHMRWRGDFALVLYLAKEKKNAR